MTGTETYTVLILINVRWWNATAFYAVNIGRMLQKKGHRVFIGCNEAYPAYKIAKSYGMTVVPLNFYGYNLIQLFKSFIHMLRLIRSENIDIINSHRSEDHTYAFLAKLFAGVKLVITRGDQRPVKKNLLSSLRYRFCDAVILTCRSIFDQNKRIFSPISHKVGIIYGSVDEDHFTVRDDREVTSKKYGIDTAICVVGIAGRLSRVKDQHTFVKAAARLLKENLPVLFVVAGKTTDFTHSDLANRLDRLKILNDFVLLDEIDDIAAVIGLFDVGVVISVASETISRVVLEYMYLGKPVIGTRVNAIDEIVEPGVTGELIAPGDDGALAEAVRGLVENPTLREAQGRNAYRLYREKYSEDVFYRQYLEVFRRLW
jgi:glycosyltransferase involved in cell wall biosynthesis